MAVSPDVVIKDLKNQKYSPVYFLQGEEAYYIDLISDFIEKNCLPENEKSFNQTIFYGKESSLNQIIQRAKQFPMMAERAVIIVKEAQELPDLGKETGDNQLSQYIQHPLHSTVLVFAYKYKTLDARKAITKLIDKHAVVVNSKKMYDNQLPDWVNGYYRSKGFSIMPKASMMLTDYIGNNLNRLANESDKLLINLQSGQEIDETLVEKYVGISKEYNVFELQKAIVSKDILKANQIVNYFEANPKANPLIPIVSVLFNFFSKLLLIYQQENKSDANLAKILQVNPFFVKDYITACKVYSDGKVMSIISDFRKADLMSKGVDSTAIGEGQILRELIFRIFH